MRPRRDGALRHLGRADDLFKVDGLLVSPAEIERALSEHPRVVEAAVVGAPQAGGLDRPAAFVVPVAGSGPRPALARELRRLVARRLAPRSRPPGWSSSTPFRGTRRASSTAAGSRGGLDRLTQTLWRSALAAAAPRP